MSNSNLKRAKAAKDDEFYTLYETIAAELRYYKDVLRGMTVLCNCDDPKRSNFWKYFHFNFAAFGLKKLISTHYEPDGSPSYKMEYEGGDDLNTEVGTVTPLEGNGDFRSEECAEILRSCDVVVTNPPFSLWIPYIKSIIDTGKLFVVIGGINVSHTKDIFPLIRDNIIRLGVSSKCIGRKINNTLLFGRPEGAVIKDPVESDGRILDHIASWWYTNINIEKRYQPFFPENANCYYEGNEDKYPIIFNTDYDMIEVDKTERIPIDWAGLMSVPVSYLGKHNPQDFSIIGYSGDRKFAKRMQELAPKGTYTQGGPSFYVKDSDNPEHYKRLFSRIVIKNLHPVPSPGEVHCYYEGNEGRYPKYVNFDGIDIDRTESIPIDYEGYMGVPVSFLAKYNPDDFEIIGLADGNLGTSIGISANITDEQEKTWKKENPGFRRGNVFFRDKDGALKKPFSRIIIRNRHPSAKKDDIRRAATE